MRLSVTWRFCRLVSNHRLPFLSGFDSHKWLCQGPVPKKQLRKCFELIPPHMYQCFVNTQNFVTNLSFKQAYFLPCISGIAMYELTTGLFSTCKCGIAMCQLTSNSDYTIQLFIYLFGVLRYF